MFFDSMVIDGVLVSCGRVMRPEEVNESLADRPALQRIVSGWYLCGDVNERMFYALAAARGECSMRMTVLTGGLLAITVFSRSRSAHCSTGS